MVLVSEHLGNPRLALPYVDGKLECQRFGFLAVLFHQRLAGKESAKVLLEYSLFECVFT